MKTAKLLSALLLVLTIGALLFAGYACADEEAHQGPRMMGFAKIYPGWVFLLWATGLVLHWLLLASFPNRTGRLTALFGRSPWKSLALGLVNLFVIIVVLSALERAKPLVLILSVIALVLLFVGIHGRSRALGRRILKASKLEQGAFAQISVGWSVVAFLCAIPYIGWFILAAYFFGGGLGALTLSFFSQPGTSKD